MRIAQIHARFCIKCRQIWGFRPNINTFNASHSIEFIMPMHAKPEVSWSFYRSVHGCIVARSWRMRVLVLWSHRFQNPGNLVSPLTQFGESHCLTLIQTKWIKHHGSLWKFQTIRTPRWSLLASGYESLPLPTPLGLIKCPRKRPHTLLHRVGG